MLSRGVCVGGFMPSTAPASAQQKINGWMDVIASLLKLGEFSHIINIKNLIGCCINNQNKKGFNCLRLVWRFILSKL